jgi:hypothetical protein
MPHIETLLVEMDRGDDLVFVAADVEDKKCPTRSTALNVLLRSAKLSNDRDSMIRRQTCSVVAAAGCLPAKAMSALLEITLIQQNISI